MYIVDSAIGRSVATLGGAGLFAIWLRIFFNLKIKSSARAISLRLKPDESATLYKARGNCSEETRPGPV